MAKGAMTALAQRYNICVLCILHFSTKEHTFSPLFRNPPPLLILVYPSSAEKIFFCIFCIQFVQNVPPFHLPHILFGVRKATVFFFLIPAPVCFSRIFPLSPPPFNSACRHRIFFVSKVFCGEGAGRYAQLYPEPARLLSDA